MNVNMQKIFYLYCTPLVLITIACLQLYFAHYHMLSAWKGGGFGMFSTVDSPEARFFRVYLMVDGVETPVKIPSDFAKLVYKVRAFPQPADLHLLAQTLVESTWVASRTHVDENDVELSNVIQNMQIQTAATKELLTNNRPQYRIQPDNETDATDTVKIQVQRIRVELWRFHFRWFNRQINAQKEREITLYPAKVN